MILCDTSTNLDQYRKKKDRKQLKTTILTPFIIDAAIMDRTEFAIDLLKNFKKKRTLGRRENMRWHSSFFIIIRSKDNTQGFRKAEIWI